MGLDQYAYLRNKEASEDINSPDYENAKCHYSWRKHARLQVFMRDLYREKNPDADKGSYGLGFNCEDNLELNLDDFRYNKHYIPCKRCSSKPSAISS